MSHRREKRSPEKQFVKNQASSRNKIEISLNGQNELNPKLYEERKDKRFFFS